MFSITNLSKSFGDKTILRPMTLSVESHRTTVIIGPSGSGKTTLLRCMNLLELPDSGTLDLEGNVLEFGQKPVAQRDILKFRQRTGMVFQSFNLFPNRTALANIMEGPLTVLRKPKGEARDEALQLLEKIGLSDKADAYPSELSGGQQQRVAIARALAMKPEVLLFDEPTSALDPELEAEVLGLIRELSEENYTIVIVTHKMSFAREVGHQFLFLSEGEILERGPFEEINASSNPRIHQFLNMV
jgi:cystine transport system ATP-binding protein